MSALDFNPLADHTEQILFSLQNELFESHFDDARQLLNDIFSSSSDHFVLYSCLICAQPWFEQFSDDVYPWISKTCDCLSQYGHNGEQMTSRFICASIDKKIISF